MCWMALIPAAIAIGGSLLQAKGQTEDASYQAGLMKQNADFKNRTADETINAGDTAADWQRVKAGQAIGTQRSVQAANAAMALEHARELYTRRNEGISLWVVEAAAISASSPEHKESWFEPAEHKTFRHASFYKLPDGVGHM